MSIVAALPLLLGLAQPADDALAHPRAAGALGARLHALLTRFEAYGFSGTVLVAREGRVVLLQGYGLADVERGIRNTAATRFEMNSMTKMFTGAAILRSSPLPRLARLDQAVLARLQGRYVSGQEVVELRAGPGYLYAANNPLRVPTDVMFFPQDGSRFTAFDPSTGARTGLQLRGRSLDVALAGGRRVTARREASR